MRSTVAEDPPPGEANFPTDFQKVGAWDMPSDTILNAVGVEAHTLANVGCRLLTSQPALDDYDQDLVDAAEVGDRLYPFPAADNDGHPGIPTLLLPLDNATGVSTNVTLTWTATDETDAYEVFLDTSTSPTTSIGITSNTQIQASNLQGNTVYRWRVVSRNTCGSSFSLSAIRTFTTE